MLVTDVIEMDFLTKMTENVTNISTLSLIHFISNIRRQQSSE